MQAKKPYYRTIRPFISNSYIYAGVDYINHEDYVKSPEQYIKPFIMLQKDLINLFDFIEPSTVNLHCYSFRIQELLIRSCIEIEANFKAILKANNYKRLDKKTHKPVAEKYWNIVDYVKLEKSHKLSYYKVKIPYFQGEGAIRQPFLKWQGDINKLQWYSDYNDVKHDRVKKFKKANFANLLDAICGLLVVLSSQFYIESFNGSHETGNYTFSVQAFPPKTSRIKAIGDYFMIDFPPYDAWEEKDKYNIDKEEWKSLDKGMHFDPLFKINGL